MVDIKDSRAMDEGQSGPGNGRSASLPSLALDPWETVYIYFLWEIFWPRQPFGKGEGGKEYIYFPRNLCKHWEGLSGAPAPSLRWGDVGVGATSGWVR